MSVTTNETGPKIKGNEEESIKNINNKDLGKGVKGLHLHRLPT
jgi:hypothetical protein